MNIVTRDQVVKNLNKYLGQDLRQLALQYGITTYEIGKQNKGWKGLTLERLTGLDNSSLKLPDGVTFELKSVAFYYDKNNNLVPKETMAITMLSPTELVEHNFFQSHCWSKLKSIIFCAVEWNEQNATDGKLLKVISLDFLETDGIVFKIKEDYDLIRNKLITQGFDPLTGKDGIWIQARTKSVGHGSTSRAFYAKKNLIQKILEEK